MQQQGLPGSVCRVCGKAFPPDELVPLEALRPRVARIVKRDFPESSESDSICLADLNRFRMDYVRQVLEAELGELSVLETDVLDSLREHDLLASNVDEQFESRRTMGERLSDLLASFGGSWQFVLLFALFMARWILLNTLVLRRAPDPFPFILLNLLLS